MQIISKIKNKGFTLIELLVVIAVIGLLASIILVSLKGARDKAKYAKAKTDLNQIMKATQIYKNDIGELPPPGDWCPGCGYPTAQAEWNRIMNALQNNSPSLPGWSGPYLQQAIPTDPWGNHYLGDDNNGNACDWDGYPCRPNCCPGSQSWLGTAGPNEVWEGGGGDDYRIIIDIQE